jgi:hypothetical protein
MENREWKTLCVKGKRDQVLNILSVNRTVLKIVRSSNLILYYFFEYFVFDFFPIHLFSI